MRTSDLNKRRAELVERLLQAVIDEMWMRPRIDSEENEKAYLRNRFSAILASRWQT